MNAINWGWKVIDDRLRPIQLLMIQHRQNYFILFPATARLDANKTVSANVEDYRVVTCATTVQDMDVVKWVPVDTRESMDDEKYDGDVDNLDENPSEQSDSESLEQEAESDNDA